MDSNPKADRNAKQGNPWWKVAFGLAVVCCVMFVRWSNLFDTHWGAALSGVCNHYDASGRVVDCPPSLLGFPRDIFDLLFAFEILALIQSGRVFTVRLMHERTVLVAGAVFLSLVGMFAFTFFAANYSGH